MLPVIPRLCATGIHETLQLEAILNADFCYLLQKEFYTDGDIFFPVSFWFVYLFTVVF